MTDQVEIRNSQSSRLSQLKTCIWNDRKGIVKWGIAGGLTVLFGFNSGISILTDELSEAYLAKCLGDKELSAEEPGRATNCALWATTTPGLAIGRALDK